MSIRSGIGESVPVVEYVSVSRRNVEPPFYLITRSSRFTEHPNPWTQRDKLPRLSGGLLGELVYGNKPVVIDDLPARLAADDPGRFYLEGIERLVAAPQCDDGEGLNVTMMLLPPGFDHDPNMIPMLHWQAGLFGRGTQNRGFAQCSLPRRLRPRTRSFKSSETFSGRYCQEAVPSIPGFELATYYPTRC